MMRRLVVLLLVAAGCTAPSPTYDVCNPFDYDEHAAYCLVRTERADLAVCREGALDDPLNCGKPGPGFSCAVTCSAPRAVAHCNVGSCIIGHCLDGYGDCDGVFANGCETPLDTAANCGGCRTRCEGACVGRVCVEPPDMAMSVDLATPPDLTPVPDLSPRPDLQDPSCHPETPIYPRCYSDADCDGEPCYFARPCATDAGGFGPGVCCVREGYYCNPTVPCCAGLTCRSVNGDRLCVP